MAGWIRWYERRWLRGDLIAGVTVAALIVPKNLGYAGIPVQNGHRLAGAGEDARDPRAHPASRPDPAARLGEADGRGLLARDGILDRLDDDETYGNIDQAVEAQMAAEAGSRADR